MANPGDFAYTTFEDRDIAGLPILYGPLELTGTQVLLHHHDGERSPQSIMAEYIDALPSGSYVALSHFFDPEAIPELSELARKMEKVFMHSPMGSGRFRTRAEIVVFCALAFTVRPR